jgi:phosphohistidine phosphatase SixA
MPPIPYRTGRRTIRLLAATLVVASLAGAVPAAAQKIPVKDLAPSTLVKILQTGGYVIYMRHVRTETDYADQVKAKMGNCATQRALSEAGWRDAVHIGQVIRRLKIPIGTVVSSQYCRAWQTAQLAFMHYSKSSDLNFVPAEKYSKNQISVMRRRLLPYLTSHPSPGVNKVLVGHDDPFEAATGTYPKPMGAVYIIRPLGEGKFEIVGKISPHSWPNALN